MNASKASNKEMNFQQEIISLEAAFTIRLLSHNVGLDPPLTVSHLWTHRSSPSCHAYKRLGLGWKRGPVDRSMSLSLVS